MNTVPKLHGFPNSPHEVIVAFIDAMNAWEISCVERARKLRGTDSTEALWGPFREELLSIHALYLTSRKRVYAEQVTFQKPPKYDSSKESVISSSIEGKTAVVQTRRVMLLGGGRYEYKLKLIDSFWKIDTVKRLVNDQWKPHIL